MADRGKIFNPTAALSLRVLCATLLRTRGLAESFGSGRAAFHFVPDYESACGSKASGHSQALLRIERRMLRFFGWVEPRAASEFYLTAAACPLRIAPVPTTISCRAGTAA